MQNINLNELLRYGFAGAAFLAALIFGYDQPKEILAKDYSNGVVAAVLITFGFSIGSIIYSIHRALPYPFLYWLFARINSRSESTIDLDVKRWRHVSQEGSLQPRLGEWAAQVHFLYCVTWASSIGLFFGSARSFTETARWSTAVYATAVMLIAALVHHYRYQKWEKRIFQEDDYNQRVHSDAPESGA